MMQIHCYYCGSEAFLAGEVVPALEGGFDVVLPCAACKKPTSVLHDDDPELAKMLLGFFQPQHEGH